MWGDFADSSNSVGSNLGYVEEGNVKKFKFTDKAQRVRFLTEDLDLSKIMSDKKITREEAIDYVNRTVAKEKWVMPKSFWEHTVKSIPNQRFFSTIVCTGRNQCVCCLANEQAKENGVTENKFLPYPIRKRFICPAFVYDLNMVLYVVGNESFFGGIAKYIEKHGSDIDFELSKSGKGFDTKYEAFFLGKSETPLPAGLEVIAPKDLDLFCGAEEVKRRIEGGSSAPKSPVHGEEPKRDVEPSASSADGEFKLPFGTYKGKTFAEIEQTDGREYIEFLAKNSVGTVQQEAEKYLSK